LILDVKKSDLMKKNRESEALADKKSTKVKKQNWFDPDDLLPAPILLIRHYLPLVPFPLPFTGSLFVF